jgi:hypothetical protein
MPGLNTSEIVVAAGSLVAYAPAGTAAPADPTAAPAVAWIDLGYVNEDGITWTESPSSDELHAWQQADPVKIVIASIARTFAFNLMQWNPDTIKVVVGGTNAKTVGPPAQGSFFPNSVGPPTVALLIRWVWETYATQLYFPRGRVTGDVSAQLVRTTSANFAATFTSTPSGTEHAYDFSTLHPSFATATVVGPSSAETAYDPGAHTVSEVTAYAASHPAEASAILEAERAGQNRAGIVNVLSEAAA